MAVTGLNPTQLQQLDSIFISSDFQGALQPGKEKASYDFFASQPQGDIFRRAFVLTHEVAASTLIKDSLAMTREEALAAFEKGTDQFGREILKAGTGEDVIGHLDEVLDAPKKYIADKAAGNFADPSHVLIAEVPSQRFGYEAVRIMKSALENALPKGTDIIKMTKDNVASDKEVEAYIPAVANIAKIQNPSDLVSFGERLSLHLYAVVCVVEGVWRTFIEAVMYLVHMMMEDAFEADGYTLEMRKHMLQMQWQSLQIVAGAVINPLDIQPIINAVRQNAANDGVDFVAADTLGTVRRGTPYAGEFSFSRSGFTSDTWAKV